MNWADVDTWKRERLAEKSRAQELHHVERRHLAGAVRHLAKLAECYRAKLVKGEVRTMWPQQLSRLGAATRARVELLALCGTWQARVPGETYHRSTNGLGMVTCDACLVALDAELEAGRAVIGDRGHVQFKP